MDFSIVYEDDDGNEYVADRSYIDRAGLVTLVRSVVQGDHNTGCFEADDPRLVAMKEAEELLQMRDSYCFKSGVYLQDFARSVAGKK